MTPYKLLDNSGAGFGGKAGSDLYLRFALRLSNESGARTFHAQAYIPTQPAQAIESSRISQAHEDPGRQEGNFPPARQGAQTGLGKTRIPRIVQWRGRERPRTQPIDGSLINDPPIGLCRDRPQSSGSGELEFRVTVTASVPGESKRDVVRRASTSAFPRSARLLRHADFERVYKLGRRHFSASMTVFYWARPEAGVAAAKKPAAKSPAKFSVAPGLRIGFTVGRALGGAVQRNRMKRRLREAVRLTWPAAGANADVVINPKKALLTVDFTAVVNEVGRAFVVIEEKLTRGARAKS